MATTKINVRSNIVPNIRVEIQNNLADDAMDVDPEEHLDDEEEEEGEITHEETSPFQSIFTTGINIFDKEEQEKLQERAKRFQLKPEEVSNFTEEDLRLLYASLGINNDNVNAVRFEAIHLRGIEQMGPEDVLEYFLKYAPVEIEWVDSESCNVVWTDKITAARALHFISKPIKGMPIRKPDPLEAVEDDDNTSILLKNRQIEIQHEEEQIDFENAVDVDKITAKIPPGYWRLGNPYPKAKNLLLRFSLKTDKKPYKSELFTRYYKNFSKLIGIEKKIKNRAILQRNKDLSDKSEKNPWGVLAKNWDEDRNFREKEWIRRDAQEKLEIKNPSILVRLGNKRNFNEEEEKEDEEKEKEEDELPSKKKVKIPRMRMYADEEEEKMKRKKLLQTITKQIEKIDETSNKSDLRNILGTNFRRLKEEPKKEFDLGATLKNRNKRMIFSVKSELESDKILRGREDVHSRLERRESPVRYKRSPPDRRYYNRSRRHSEEFSDDEHDNQKPRSKVAVVIKTSRKPTVASSVNSVWSRVNRRKEESSSDSESSSSSDSSKSSGIIEGDDSDNDKCINRPGFRASNRDLNSKVPLKIEISNNHFKN